MDGQTIGQTKRGYNKSKLMFRIIKNTYTPISSHRKNIFRLTKILLTLNISFVLEICLNKIEPYWF